MALITINDPDDIDGTDSPIFEGDIDTVPLALYEGTYLATSTDDDTEAVTYGTVTVSPLGTAFRPFFRTPEDRVGLTFDGDVACGEDCGALGDDDNLHDYFPLTIGGLADFTATHCDGCGTVLLDFDERNAAVDVMFALAAATGQFGGIVGTGGGCRAYNVDLPGDRFIYVTDGDAQAPDGIGMCAALYRSADDDDPIILVDGTESNSIPGAHDPVRLYRATKRALGDLPPVV